MSLDNIVIFTIVTIIKARNLSYKAILGHTWISEFCPEADLVVKADDDFMVDLPLLRYIYYFLFGLANADVRCLLNLHNCLQLPPPVI